MIKRLIALLLLICFCNCCYASPVIKKVESPDSSLKVYIYKYFIKRNDNMATYTVKTYNKTNGSKLIIAVTDCSTMKTGIASQPEFSYYYIPKYDNIVMPAMNTISSSSYLYAPAVYACKSKDTYEKTMKNGGDDETLGHKILGKIGDGLVYVIMIPVGIISWLWTASEEAKSNK